MTSEASRHRRASSIGTVTVHLVPSSSDECDYGKSALDVRITLNGQEVWAPDSPLCLSPLHDPETRAGRSEAADAAIDFFESALSENRVNRNPAEIEPGTVISGTLRLEDLIPALFDELERIDPSAAGELASEYRDVFDGANHLNEEGEFLLDALFDALSERAPKGFYFGAYPGDGADFGWWPTEE